jgi:hypothetical protein
MYLLKVSALQTFNVFVYVNQLDMELLFGVSVMGQIPVTARCKIWVCGRSLFGTACSNPAEGMDVSVLRGLCVVR